MNVNVDPAAMQALVTKALFEGMTQEQKDSLITQALTALMTSSVRKNHWDPQPLSPLQEAFNNAASVIARQVAIRRLETDEQFKASVEQLFTDLGKKLFASEFREKLIERLANAVFHGLRGQD